MAWQLTSVADDATLDNINNGPQPELLPIGTIVTCSDDEELALERAGLIAGTDLVGPHPFFTAVYIGGSGGGGGAVNSVNASDASLRITPTTGDVNAAVRVSGDAGNALSLHTDGLFATAGGSGGIPEAPTDGRQYGRQSSGWTVTIPEAPSDGKQYGRQGSNWTVIQGGGGEGYVPVESTLPDPPSTAIKSFIINEDGNLRISQTVEGPKYDEDKSSIDISCHYDIEDKEDFVYKLRHTIDDSQENVLDIVDGSFYKYNVDEKSETGFMLNDNGIIRFSQKLSDTSNRTNDILINTTNGEISDGTSFKFLNDFGLFGNTTGAVDRTGTWGVKWDDAHTYKWYKIDGGTGGEDLTAAKAWEYDAEGLDIPISPVITVDLLKARFKLVNGLATSLSYPRKGDTVEILANGISDRNYICYVHNAVDIGSQAEMKFTLVVQNIIENGR